VRVRRLHDAFGVEILDVDLFDTAPAEIDDLRAALAEHQFLLFRPGRRVPPERHVEIVGWFGPLTDDTGDGRRWSVLHNQDPAGSARLPYHSDFTYTDSPIKVISLHAIELPPGGASTAYASGINGWATLPRDRQDELAPMTVRHAYQSYISSELPDFEAVHPVRFVHPRNGRPVLFVTEFHAKRILDLDEAESERVLDELFAHLYAPERVYVHDWQLHDFVIWDNLAVQHARLAEAAIADGARALQRVTINEVTYPELIERAREQQRRRAGVDVGDASQAPV